MGTPCIYRPVPLSLELYELVLCEHGGYLEGKLTHAKRINFSDNLGILSQNQGTNKKIPEHKSESLAHLLSFHE